MEGSWVWWLALGPAALALSSLRSDRAADAEPALQARLGIAAGSLAFAAAIGGAILLALRGPAHSGTLGAAGIGLSIGFDSLTAIVLLLVSLVGLVVLRYSRNYLAGDPGQGRFIRWLSLTLAAVLMLILSGNVALFALAWVATSIGLQRLLRFYPDRPAAVLAARKKFITGRIADLCLLAAAVLAWRQFGSLDHRELASDIAALGAGAVPGSVHAIALLVVVAALLKSAQFPLHGWLLEVMETPTPVSALLHAGIVNAGGFLLLRHADLVSASPAAMALLLVVGGLSALAGSVAMLAQTSVKVALAWSTIAQLGFMMLQCGLGAWSAALLHLVAHSLYKAHAFLSSGSVVDLARASTTLSPGGRAHPARLALALAIVLGAAFGVGTLAGATLVSQPGSVALGAIVMLGLVHYVVGAIDERNSGYVLGRALATAIGVAALYYTLQWLAAALTRGTLPPPRALASDLELALVLLVVASFAALTLLQARLPGPAADPRWLALHAHAANGFYVNTLANRLVIRFWPAPPPRASNAPHPAGAGT